MTMRNLRLFWLLVIGMGLCLWTALPATTLHAATFVAEETFVLAPEEVIAHDLFVAANEVIIQGTVEGDLFAAASAVAIEGTVEGTAYLAAYTAVLSGQVQGDVMCGCYNLVVDGQVGQDIRSGTGGMDNPVPFAAFMDEAGFEPYRSLLHKGLVITSNAQIAGDILAGGQTATLAGAIAQDAVLAMEQVFMQDTSRVDGNLKLYVGSAEVGGTVGRGLEVTANNIVFDPNLAVGDTIRYRSAGPIETAPANATYLGVPEEQAAEGRNQAEDWRLWLWRTFTVLVGFALLAFLTRNFLARGCVENAARMAREQTGIALVWGVISLLSMPFLLLLIPAVIWFLFGSVVALLVLIPLLLSWILFWIFSPLITGRSLAFVLQRETLPGERPSFASELAGIILLVLLVRLFTLPADGPDIVNGVLNGLAWLGLGLSYLLAAGGWVQTWKFRGARPQASA